MNTRGENSSNKLGDQEGGGSHHLHHHKQFVVFSPNGLKIMLLLSLATLTFLLLYHSAYPIQYALNISYNAFSSSSSSSNHSSDHERLISPTNHFEGANSSLGGNSSSQSPNSSTQANPLVASLQPASTDTNESKEYENLKAMLQKAAMADNTVILTTLNKAWSEPNAVFDLFLESFKIGNNTQHLLNHVIVAALDQSAFSRCKMLHPYCYYLTTKDIDFSSEALFMTETYLKMMWRRIDFLRIVLDMGYNFIFTDVDILWFRDPFLHFFPEADFQIACDRYNNNASDLNNALNGGFNFVKSNNRTTQFYRYFYRAKDDYPGRHDQDVLNLIKFDPFLNEIGIQIRFLDTTYYGGFCEPSKDLNEVCTMHANCCIGLENKVVRLKRLLDDWKNYMVLSITEKLSKPMTWTIYND